MKSLSMKALFSPGVVFNSTHLQRGVAAAGLQIQEQGLEETNIL